MKIIDARTSDMPQALTQAGRQVVLRISNGSGTINTSFDSTLDIAIKNFQYSRGVTVDGNVGSKTWILLFPIVKKAVGAARRHKSSSSVAQSEWV